MQPYLSGKTYYLDATNEYIPLEFIPGSIQGREAMIENGEECIVQTVPILDSSASTDSLYYTCTLSGEQTDRVLQGRATRSWSGDMKEFFLTAYHKTTKATAKNTCFVHWRETIITIKSAPSNGYNKNPNSNGPYWQEQS